MGGGGEEVRVGRGGGGVERQGREWRRCAEGRAAGKEGSARERRTAVGMHVRRRVEDGALLRSAGRSTLRSERKPDAAASRRRRNGPRERRLRHQLRTTGLGG